MTNKNKKGFTIIEVVLVLAIAGLIFLMVFIALPAMQRSQRNTQRANDISRFLTAVNQYQSNNSGKIPFSTDDTGNWAYDNQFVKRYIDNTCTASATPSCSGGEFKDPDGTNYSFVQKGSGTVTNVAPTVANGAVDHKIYVVLKAMCDGVENQSKTSPGKRDIALFYNMEGGSVRCFDNQ